MISIILHFDFYILIFLYKERSAGQKFTFFFRIRIKFTSCPHICSKIAPQLTIITIAALKQYNFHSRLAILFFARGVQFCSIFCSMLLIMSPLMDLRFVFYPKKYIKLLRSTTLGVDKLALNWLCFPASESTNILINPCYHWLCAHFGPSKLALFFQIGFSTPQQCWGLTEIGFVFSNGVCQISLFRISDQKRLWLCFFK